LYFSRFLTKFIWSRGWSRSWSKTLDLCLHGAEAAICNYSSGSAALLQNSYFQAGSPQAGETTQALCNFVILTFIPTSIIDMWEEAEPQFKIPIRNTIQKYVNSAWPDLKSVIMENLASADEVHLTADYWSTRVSNASCLVVTVHFYSPVNKKREMFAIACREFASPHTGCQIAALIQVKAREFGIYLKLRQVSLLFHLYCIVQSSDNVLPFFNFYKLKLLF
jgi:hypothetical protein